MPSDIPQRAIVQVLTFGCVGVVGFVVDAGLFWWFYRHWQIDMIGARLLAFFPATVVTWLLNRTLTFKAREGRSVRREYSHYVSIQILGSVLNFFVFYSLVKWLPAATAMPLIPLAFASGMAMVFNFLGAKWLVYRT